MNQMLAWPTHKSTMG